MLVHGFDMHRVYLSAPGDLEAEKQACRAAITEVNANDAMQDKILLVSVGLREEGAVEQARAAVADNIRQCAYFIQVFQDDWGPKHLMRKMFYVAYDGLTDESLQMRDVVVLLKDAPRETDPEILGFRKELEELANVRVMRFARAEEVQPLLEGILKGWIQQIRETSAVAAAAP